MKVVKHTLQIAREVSCLSEKAQWVIATPLLEEGRRGKESSCKVLTSPWCKIACVNDPESYTNLTFQIHKSLASTAPKQLPKDWKTVFKWVGLTRWLWQVGEDVQCWQSPCKHTISAIYSDNFRTKMYGCEDSLSQRFSGHSFSPSERAPSRESSISSSFLHIMHFVARAGVIDADVFYSTLRVAALTLTSVGLICTGD